MIITNEEREYLKSKMIDLLEEYDYTWEDDALDTILDTWITNKGPLIELFKKHPNYVEGKFMIAFDTNYDREIDISVVFDFKRWLMKYVHLVVPHLPSEMDEQRIADCCGYLPDKLYNFIACLEHIAARTISEETADFLKEHASAVHAHAGQKTSRVINKLLTYLGFDKIEITETYPVFTDRQCIWEERTVKPYNREFAKYADALSPLTIKRHTILSLNPLDYLTMSFGNSWSSCHTIDKDNKRDMPNGYQGQYSSGTMSYLLDESSMVFYTVDASYDGDEYFDEPKITRQMYHYGEDKLVQGRLYPGSNDGATEFYTQYRNIVQQIMAEILEIPNLWTVSRNAGSMVHSKGTHYQDYHHFSSCTLSKVKGTENEEYITIGHRPICIECGNHHDITESINCCNLPNGMVRCADCGRIIDEDEAHWVDDEPYCGGCVNYCSHCECWHREEEYYVRHYNSWGGAHICETCYNEDFTTCSDCGEIIRNEDTYYIEGEDRDVCSDCHDNWYRECAECGEEYHIVHMHQHNDEWYCATCHSEVEEEAV